MTESGSFTVSELLRSLLQISKGEWTKRAWYVLLVIFTVTVAALTLPGRISLPSYVALIFYAFVPGYSFVQAMARKTVWFEKLVASILFSIAFMMGIRALDRTINLQTEGNASFLPTSPSEFGLVFSLTLVLLVYLTWRAFRNVSVMQT